MKYIIILFLLAGFTSCTKDDKQPEQDGKKLQQEETDLTVDTNLTPEEKFSAAIMTDFLDDSEDDDLAGFLESEIYTMGAAYNGASVTEVTPSTWLVSFEKDGTVKNYLLQKYADIKTNEYYFSMKETSLTVTDVISRKRNKLPAGD